MFPWTIRIPYSELAEFDEFSSYLAYLISQFDYQLNIIEAVKCYEIYFKEERESQRALTLYNVWIAKKVMGNTVTRKLTKEEFLDFHEWCYNNIESAWLIYEYNEMPNLFTWEIEVPIFVESEEEMVLLKLKWC